MKKIKLILLILVIVLSAMPAQAQEITNTIRGTVLDKESLHPLGGVTIAIRSTSPLKGAVTDFDGLFRIDKVPIGRHDIEITYLGYQRLLLSSILVEAGKELVLNLEMLESAEMLEEVVVSASTQLDKTKPLNEFATLSARTFSVEETGRYANSNFDPSRMAQNYAGVSAGSGNDIYNEIIIRGNAPGGVLWRLEGVEIPNPNHFGAMGNSGGAISMLSSSTLSNSDFYTGAFPSEFGNAVSGVFDLKLRKGNNEKRAYSFMLGALGIELAAEGPFSKKSKASYLINYRYSTLALLEAMQLNPTGDILPKYQDLSFKINVPTKRAGVFALFGLGGNNEAANQPQADSSLWSLEFDKWGFIRKQTVGTIGLSHRILLNDKSYLNTVLMGAYEYSPEDEYWFDENDNYQKVFAQYDEATTKTYRLSTTYSNKLNKKNTIRIGAIISYNDFKFRLDQREEETGQLVRLFDNSGSTALLQSFAHWKHRFNNSLTLNLGMHYSQMTLNDKMAIEPRAAIQWNLNSKNTLSFASGLHSKMEQLGVYLFEGVLPNGNSVRPKKHLGFTKSFHNVLGYDLVFNPSLRLKTELYYQYIFDVPVEDDLESIASLLNAFDNWDALNIGEAVADGTGRNIGIDLTLEKFFDRQYYFMITGSLYDSKYAPHNGKYYNTRFNGNYQLNTLGGKEFKIGKSDRNTFGINGKFTLSGGNRFSPINELLSQAAGEEVIYKDEAYEERSGVYYRVDIGLRYKVNTKKVTHSLMIDFQNVTNRKNVWRQYFDPGSNQIEFLYQSGFFPTFNYRVEW